MYAWELQQLEIFEPQYSLSNTSFLYTDNLITDDLLALLGIARTCTLQSDHYHLFANVFPDFFGDYVFYQMDLKQLLTVMLTGIRRSGKIVTTMQRQLSRVTTDISHIYTKEELKT